MLQFIVGVFVGIFVQLFIMGVMVVVDEEDDRVDKCRGCPYEGYGNGVKDCLVCHGAEDER